MRDLRLIKPGKWYNEFDENGNCTRSVYDKSYRELIGYETEDEYANSWEAWKAIIHPEDLDRVNKLLEECLKKHPEGMDFDTEYRMLTKWGYHWFHVFGHCDRREDGSIQKCDGVIFDIQGTVEKIYSHNELEQSNMRILALQDNLESIYDVNLSTGEYSEFTKDKTFYSMIENKLINRHNFFEDLIKNTEEVVVPEDRKGIYKVLTPSYIVKSLKKNSHFDYYYRLNTNNQVSWFRMRVVYKDAEKKNVLLGIFNADEEIEKKQSDEKQRNELINQIMGGESGYLVNPQTDEYEVIYRNRYLAETYGVYESYSESVEKYIEEDVFEPDREEMRKATSVKTLAEKTANGNDFVYMYRDTSSGVAQWYKMRATMLSATEILLGFANVDSEYLRSLFHDRTDSEYFAMFVANLDEQVLKIERESPWYETGKVGDAIPYTATFTTFAKANEGETAEFFAKLSNIDYVKKLFEKEDKISYTYKSRFVAGERWIVVEFTVLSRHDDGTVEAFAMGFKYTDSMTSEKQEMQESLNANRIVIEALTEDFGCVNYIILKDNDYNNDTCITYRVSALLKRLIPGWENETSFTNKMRLLYHNVIYEQDKQHFREDVNREKLIEELSRADTYFVNFRTFYDNEIRYYQLKASAVRENGELIGVVVGIHSVDETVKKEMAVQTQLEKAITMAQSANEAKTTFLFNMSHDIRTPMNAIRGFTAMAKKYVNNKSKVLDYLNKIDISGEQLLTLINQVLEMARIEAGKIEFDLKPINVKEEFKSMVTVIFEQAAENGLDFHFDLRNIKHYHVLADEARMGSITLNIAGNAIKYTPEGGRIDFYLTEVPSSSPKYARYTFTVKDTGIGMSEEYIKELFEPFTRERTSSVSRIQGTGLGMSIVKKLVDILGGTIEVHSEPGKGTQFDVTIEFEICEEQKTKKEIEQEIEMVSFEGKRVLLAEDNEMNREIARDILDEHGLFVDEAEDGDVAVEKVEEAFDRGDYGYYDVILMDVQMPRMNGYEATKAIRNLPWPEGVHIPIFAMTANAFEEDRQDAIDAGMDEHLAKPLNIKKLLETLSRFMA